MLFTEESNIWVISKGRSSNFIFENNDNNNITVIKEYDISDFGKYLLNPNPIGIKEKIIGCEVHYKQSAFDQLKEKIRRFLPKRLQGWIKLKENRIDEFRKLSRTRPNQSSWDWLRSSRN